MYKTGDQVWLKAVEHEPRQRAIVMGPEENGAYVVSLDKRTYELDHGDDGFREVPAEQVDGFALTGADYKMAVDLQDASNLSGVLYEFARQMHKIRGDTSVGADQAARHPIAILMLDKLVSLAGGTVRWLENDETYGKALDACRAAATEDASQLV